MTEKSFEEKMRIFLNTVIMFGILMPIIAFIVGVIAIILDVPTEGMIIGAITGPSIMLALIAYIFRKEIRT